MFWGNITVHGKARTCIICLFQFDIRVYVLLTSLDPLTVYLYEDGLVRIATEQYTEHPGSVHDCCIHVTNFAVNSRDNAGKFKHSKNVSACEGHKVRKVQKPFHDAPMTREL